MAAFEEGQDIAIRGFLTARQRIRRVSTVALALATDTNNAAPTGLSTASTLLVTCSVAGTKITGLAAGALGDEITIRAEYNSQPFILSTRDPASTSTNWFSLAQSITLQAYQSITFRYQLVASGNAAWVPIDDRSGVIAHAVGISAAIGQVGGSVLLLNATYDLPASPKAYTVTGWQLQCEPGGALNVEVLSSAYSAFDIYTSLSGTSSSTGGIPKLGAAVLKGTSSDVSLWNSTAIAQGDLLRLKLQNVSGNPTWFSLLLFANWNF